MAQRKKKATTRGKNTEKKVTRYTYDEIKEPRTPETGHTRWAYPELVDR